MFEGINFVIRQLQRLKKAMQAPELAGFAPDGKSAADVAGMLSAVGSSKPNVVSLDVGLRGARGAQASIAQVVHDHCVDVYASMRSIYRRDFAQLRAIRRIPTRDRSPRQTLTRADVTAGVWAQLPNMPGTQNPFKVGALTLAVFNGKVADLRAKTETCEGCQSAFDVAQGNLTALTVELSNFVSAAVTQGRSEYAVGTPGRAWIDTIPLEAGTQKPAQAVIREVTSPEAGAVHLAFDAAHATSFTIKHKGPGQAEFVTAAEDVTEETYDGVNLPVGEHQYVVVGHNSRGDGPASAIATVRVTMAAAA